MGNKFNNQSSQCLFIGDRNLEKVIFQDRLELSEIRGSFESIAYKMQQYLDFIKNKYDKREFITSSDLDCVINPLIDEYDLKYGKVWGNNRSLHWKDYEKDWAKKISELPITHYNEKVSVLNMLNTRGFQQCPFGCDFFWSEDVNIYNREKLRELTINKGTIHLVREHNLIEKDNKYGISAKEFYELFM